jgi:hypothetical protein
MYDAKWLVHLQMQERRRRMKQEKAMGDGIQHSGVTEASSSVGSVGQAEAVTARDEAAPSAEASRGVYERLKRELAASAQGQQLSKTDGVARNSGWRWRGKGTQEEDDASDDDGGGSDPETSGMSELERQRAKYLKRKRETAGLTREQRQRATLQKLQGFKQALGQADEDEKEGWKSHRLKYEREKREAESASTYDSFDPLRHGSDASRANAKIKDRERAFLSMKQGF